MRLSLWQQFSSNHSAHFSIVGVFPSAEAAQQAAEKLRNVLTQIDQWHRDHPDESIAIFESTERISEVERSFAQTYQMNWDQPVLWAWNYLLFIQDNLLVLTHDRQADSGAHPMEILVQKLGAEVGVDGEIQWEGGGDYSLVRFEITCIAPNEEAASFLFDHIIYKDKVQVLPIADSHSVQVKLGPRRFDYGEPPELFSLVNMLKKRGCQQIEVKLTSQMVDGDGYDELGDEVE